MFDEVAVVAVEVADAVETAAAAVVGVVAVAVEVEPAHSYPVATGEKLAGCWEVLEGKTVEPWSRVVAVLIEVAVMVP